MALFSKIGLIEIPDGQPILGIKHFKKASGKIVNEEKDELSGVRIKIFTLETGINGSLLREKFYCPLDSLGRFRESKLTGLTATIKPRSMQWICGENSFRIEENKKPSINRIRSSRRGPRQTGFHRPRPALNRSF